MELLSPSQLFDFSRSVVVITGASGGIGAGIALRFSQAGASVVVHYCQNEPSAQQLATRIQTNGKLALIVRADVTQRQGVESLAARSVEEFGHVDIWINNAGTYPIAALTDMTESDWDGVVNSNLRSVFLCTQVAARQMIAQKKGGAIINIASIEAENPAQLHAHYDAAKAGVVMHTRVAANELGPHGIRVNSVSPGLIWRNGIEQQWPEGVGRWMKACPLGRLGTPNDVADACLFLASPAARWITGTNLVVDGGILTHQVF